MFDSKTSKDADALAEKRLKDTRNANKKRICWLLMLRKALPFAVFLIGITTNIKRYKSKASA